MGLSERFYGGVFVVAIVVVGLAALAALVLTSVRGFSSGFLVTAIYGVTGLIAAATPPAVWRARALYCGLRRRPELQLAPVLLAAGLVAHPAIGHELWWPSCALLMALAVIAPLRRVLAYCLLVLCANVAGHLVAADLDETSVLGIIGLWTAYPLWVVATAIVGDRLAAHLLRLNATRTQESSHGPPRRVHAWTNEPPPATDTAASASTERARNEQSTTRVDEHGDDVTVGRQAITTGRLTARQIQVVALLADGLRHREIADCLSISERQVQRHVAEAVARVDVRNAHELVAVVVSEGLVPSI